MSAGDFAVGLSAACALLALLGWIANRIEAPRRDSRSRNAARPWRDL